MTILASDTFTRTVAASGWGSADSGGAWTTNSATGVQWSVNGSKGISSAGAGSTGFQRLGSVSSTSTEIYQEVTFPAVPSGGSSYVYLTPRSITEVLTGTPTSYRVSSAVSSTVNIAISVNGTTVVNSGSISGLTLSAGDTLCWRVQAFGTNPTTIRGRVWKKTGTEPTSWTVTTTDSTSALQTTGAVSNGTYLGSGVTNTPFVMQWDNLAVQDVGNTAPTANPGSDYTVNSTATVNVTDASASDPDGYVASYAWTWVALPPGVTAPSISNSNTASPSFSLPSSGRYTLQMIATDDQGATSTPVYKNIFWPDFNIYATGVGSNPQSWAIAGGGDIISNLYDSNDGTGVDAPGVATTATSLNLVLAPLVANPSTFSMTVRELLTASATGVTYTISLVDQGTVRKTWNKTSDLSTSATDSACSLTSAEINTITNWNDLRLNITWQTS